MKVRSRYHEVALEELVASAETPHEGRPHTPTVVDGDGSNFGFRNENSAGTNGGDDLSLSVTGADDDESFNSLSHWGSAQLNDPLQVLPRPIDDDSLTTGTITTAGSRKISLTTLITNQDGERVMQRIQRHPRSMRHRHNIQLNGKNTRAHPLHHVVSLNPPVTIVDAMIGVFPEACRLPDRNFGQLPLHIACNFRAETVVLKSLLKAFPEAVKLTDAGQRLPLHYACHVGDPNNVDLLLQYDKNGLSAKDFDDMTPLDMCRASQSPQRGAVLKQMIDVSRPLDGSTSTSQSGEVAYLRQHQPADSTPDPPTPSQPPLQDSMTREIPSQPSAQRGEVSIDRAKPPEENVATLPPPGEATTSNTDKKRKKKSKQRSFSSAMKNLRHRSKKHDVDNTMDHSSNSTGMFRFLHKRDESDLTDDSNSSMNSRLGESFSSLNSRLSESLNSLSFQRPMLDVKPPRKNDELDSALIPWIASGAEIVAPTRGTALSIRRPRAQSMGDRNHRSMSAIPRTYKRESTGDIEESHNSLPALSYNEPDAIDVNLVKDHYSGYIEHTKPDEDNSIKKGHLKRRKAALMDELKRAHDNIKLKKEKAATSQRNMDEMGIKVQELIEAIEKERTSLDFAKSAIRSNEEIAAQHEENIRKVDQELASLGVNVEEDSFNDDDSLDLSAVFGRD